MRTPAVDSSFDKGGLIQKYRCGHRLLIQALIKGINTKIQMRTPAVDSSFDKEGLIQKYRCGHGCYSPFDKGGLIQKYKCGHQLLIQALIKRD